MRYESYHASLIDLLLNSAVKLLTLCRPHIPCLGTLQIMLFVRATRGHGGRHVANGIYVSLHEMRSLCPLIIPACDSRERPRACAGARDLAACLPLLSKCLGVQYLYTYTLFIYILNYALYANAIHYIHYTHSTYQVC